jgi:hypothetical protein
MMMLMAPPPLLVEGVQPGLLNAGFEHQSQVQE